MIIPIEILRKYTTYFFHIFQVFPLEILFDAPSVNRAASCYFTGQAAVSTMGSLSLSGSSGTATVFYDLKPIAPPASHGSARSSLFERHAILDLPAACSSLWSETPSMNTTRESERSQVFFERPLT